MLPVSLKPEWGTLNKTSRKHVQNNQLHFSKVTGRRAPRKRVCCFGLWTRRRRRDLALSIPESGHSPRRVDSGPPNLYVAPAHVISSLNTQQAMAEGEQRLEPLQRAVARLEHEKAELKQLNAELRRTLEQVKQAFTASAKPHGPLEHNTFPQTALGSPLIVSFPLPLPLWTHTFVFSLFWHPIAFTNAHSLRHHPSCPSVPIHTHLTLLCQELVLLLFLFHSLQQVLFTRNVLWCN